MLNISKTHKLCILALLAAITIIMAFTPLGFIPLPFMKATILHVPAITAAVLLGPKAGAFMGLVFGTCSVVKATVSPGIVSFAYSPFLNIPGSDQGTWYALIIAYLPRICMGIATGFIALALIKTKLKPTLQFTLCGVIGSLINSLLSLSCVYIFLREPYAAALGVEEGAFIAVLAGIFVSNSIMEAVIAAILVAAVCTAVYSAFGKIKKK